MSHIAEHSEEGASAWSEMEAGQDIEDLPDTDIPSMAEQSEILEKAFGQYRSTEGPIQDIPESVLQSLEDKAGSVSTLQITALQDTVSSLQATVTSLETQIEELKTSFDEIKQTRSVSEEISVLREEISALSKRIQDKVTKEYITKSADTALRMAAKTDSANLSFLGGSEGVPQSSGPTTKTTNVAKVARGGWKLG